MLNFNQSVDVSESELEAYQRFMDFQKFKELDKQQRNATPSSTTRGSKGKENTSPGKPNKSGSKTNDRKSFNGATDKKSKKMVKPPLGPRPAGESSDDEMPKQG